jgi:hypothetical protein
MHACLRIFPNTVLCDAGKPKEEAVIDQKGSGEALAGEQPAEEAGGEGGAAAQPAGNAGNRGSAAGAGGARQGPTARSAPGGAGKGAKAANGAGALSTLWKKAPPKKKAPPAAAPAAQRSATPAAVDAEAALRLQQGQVRCCLWKPPARMPGHAG